MVKRYLSLTSLEEALRLLKTSFSPPTGTETIPLIESLGRVVTAPVHAKYSVPEVNIAAMDGIAVRSRDTLSAAEQAPVTLDQVARVNTGNIIPPGFDAVVMIEETWEQGGRFQVRRAVAPGQHVRLAGEDIRKGQMVLASGHQVRAFDIGALATYGITSLDVRSVKVGIIPTGSELVPLGVRPGPGQVVESNTLMAQVFLGEMGASCTKYPIVPDDPSLIRDALAVAVAAHDLVVISAGSSAGTRDFTAGAIGSLGELIFHGVAMKPGKPAMLGSIGGKPVLGLPGYPLAAQTVLRELAAPLLESWGLRPPPRCTVQARLSQPLSSDLGFDEFVQVSVGHVRDRRWAIPHSRGSAVQMATVRSNAYVHIPARAEGLEAIHETAVTLTTDPGSIERTVLLVGLMDPALGELADLAYAQGLFLHLSGAAIPGALLALGRGSCHAALLGLPPPDLVPPASLLSRRLRVEGLPFLHIASVPLGIASREGIGIGDLTGLRFINGMKGSAPRLILDALLASRGIDPSAIEGYSREASPRDAAAAIRAGLADATLCRPGIAGAEGLRFRPVADEEYGLAVPPDLLDDPVVGSLIALVRSAEMKKRLGHLCGYDTSHSGEIRRLSPSGTG
ncbi:MAG TPA: molybdopterin-binding protein [Methanomicrobiales archaeon]|nr:molybdopterin-binding protein [Methanomicrobiales archaeon]